MNWVHRRTLPRRMALLVASALAFACARRAPEGPVVDSELTHQVSAADRVFLERGSCFGTCPVYTVSLDRSGVVRFEGRRFVADTGVFSAVVPPMRVDSLLAELEAGGFQLPSRMDGALS